MEENNYWELFWRTGLPMAWLLSRYEEKPPAVAALSPSGPDAGSGSKEGRTTC